MTRDDYIEFEANSYGNMIAGGSTMNTPITLAFKQGVLFADHHPKCPWISVEDDLPCNHEELMAKRLFSYEKETVHVLTLLPDGDIVIDFMVHNRGKWKWWSHHRPTHWFPIPELPKEQEIKL